MRVRLSGVAAVAGLVLVTGLTGCGTTTHHGAATEKHRTVTDASGARVSVPVRPRRVVTLSEPTLDGALALGVTPVGTTAGRGQSGPPAYLARRAAGIPVVATVAQPDLEKITTLHPDLILTDGTVNGSAIPQLTKIAPVVVTAKHGADWRQAFRDEAAALNRTGRASAVLRDLDRRIASTRAKLGGNAAATVSVVRWAGNAPAMIFSDGPVGYVLHGLGVRRPAAERGAGPGHSEPVSTEKLDTIDGDWMFFGALAGKQGGGDASSTVSVEYSREALKQAATLPGFTALRAWRKHRVVPVDGSSWTSAGGVLAARAILSDVDTNLTGGGS